MIEQSATIPRQEAVAFRDWYREQRAHLNAERTRIGQYFCQRVDQADIMTVLRQRLGASVMQMIDQTLTGDEATTYPVFASGEDLREFERAVERINKAWEGQLKFTFIKTDRTDLKICLRTVA